MRGFQKISKDENNDLILLPKRSTARSAGYDFFSPGDFEIKSGESIIIKTGIKAFMMEDECLFIYPRSSIGIKHGIMLKNTIGVIDSDCYNNEDNEGEIMVCLHNFSEKIFLLKKGDRFCQGIFQKVLFSENETDKELEIEKRRGGLGSTGN